MKTVLDVLKAMEKATAREIAARMEIEPAEMLGMLRDHEERGEVSQINGYWQAANGGTKPPKSTAKPPVRVSVSDLMALLVEHGPKTADELAKLAGIEAKRVAPALTHHMTKGRVFREKVGNKFTYSVVAAGPEKAITPEPEKVPEPDMPEKSITEIVEEIPVFVSRPDDLLIPTVRGISSEIRRTRAKLANLEKLRDAVRSIRKHGALVKEVCRETV